MSRDIALLELQTAVLAERLIGIAAARVKPAASMKPCSTPSNN